MSGWGANQDNIPTPYSVAPDAESPGQKKERILRTQIVSEQLDAYTQIHMVCHIVNEKPRYFITREDIEPLFLNSDSTILQVLQENMATIKIDPNASITLFHKWKDSVIFQGEDADLILDLWSNPLDYTTFSNAVRSLNQHNLLRYDRDKIFYFGSYKAEGSVGGSFICTDKMRREYTASLFVPDLVLNEEQSRLRMIEYSALPSGVKDRVSSILLDLERHPIMGKHIEIQIVVGEKIVALSAVRNIKLEGSVINHMLETEDLRVATLTSQVEPPTQEVVHSTTHTEQPIQLTFDWEM